MKNENTAKKDNAQVESAEVKSPDERKKLDAGMKKIRSAFCCIKKNAGEFYRKSGKKTAAVVCSVLLIGGAVVLNLVLFSGEPGAGDGKDKLAVDLSTLKDGAESLPTAGDNSGESSDDYFATVSLGRQQARDEAMEVLLQVTNDVNATPEAKASASADINRIALDIEREGTIESLVMARGFEDCVAIVNGDSASVIVGGDTLSPGQTAQISEIVYEAAGIVPANLKIVEKNKMS